MSNPAQLPSPQELEQAFSLFNQASSQLASAYQDLQQQVARLTGELAFANGELRQQYVEKEALSQRLALLLEALPGGVIVLDAQGLVAQANPAACRLLGDDVVGRPWSTVEAQRLSAGGTPQEWELRASEASMEPRWVSISASAFDIAGGRILLLSDITQARRLHEALERHQRLSAMGQMAAGLAHQLRTPLTTALLYAGNLVRPQLSEADRQRFAERVQARLRDLERMIQDMLGFVRGEPGGEDAFGVDELMHELAQVIEPQMHACGVRFEMHTRCASARVRGNRKALSGAFVNLLENALQACGGQGEVRLDARVEGGMVEVSVTDNGAGMDAAVQARLFEPFFTTRSEGTGLGLAIVRNVTEAHGGEIRVESAPGRGSVFSVTLPITGA